jgi:Cys-tRNA(Pro)/Cys-tRNA(Cys) deacylase
VPAKPLAVRLLEQRRIPHTVYEFDSVIRSAHEVAQATWMPVNAVYKTLVVEEDPPRGKPNLVMVPAGSEIDLKALARALEVKKLRMASHRDAERLTGLQVGGISALALTGKGFPVYVDARVLALERVLVSAGQRGMDVGLSVADLLAVTAAHPVEGCSRPSGGGES